MPKETESTKSEENVEQSRGINRLCAAVKMPYGRPNTLFVGWDKNGVLMTSTDQSTLSEQARTSFGITKSQPFPYNRELAALPIEPVEFIGSSKPFDRKDTSEEELTQDILTYWVTKGVAGPELIQIQELDLLGAILKGQLVWEDFNENAMGTDDKVSGQNMYTLLFPAVNADKEQVMYLMTFKPPMPNESNESMYRQFLIQTLKTLASIDKAQPAEYRKGYLEAIGLNEDGVEAQGEGGLLAVGALDILRTALPGIFYLSDERMNQIRRDSSGKSIPEQMKIILREFGLYNVPSSPHTPADLDSYPVEALLAVTGAAYKLAERAINK